MASNLEFQMGTYGIVFSITTGVNMTNTTNLKLVIRKGDGTKIERDLTSSAITNAPTGTIAYTVQEDDLDVDGEYGIQLIDTTPGKFVPSVVQKFDVLENA